MKQLFNTLIFSLCIALSGVTQLQADFSKTMKQSFYTYGESLARITKISVAHPFAILNIGSHDPDDKPILKADMYKKLIRSLRSSVVDARRGALKATAFFKTDAGKRVLYETGLFSLVMAGGYKVWLQNQQTQELIDILQGALAQHMADSLSSHRIAQSRHDTLKADIAATDANVKRRVKRVRDGVAHEMNEAKKAMRILAAELRAPNRVQAAASTVRSGFAGAWHGACKWKADLDARLEKEERDLDAQEDYVRLGLEQEAQENSDDENDAGSDGSGASDAGGELRGIEEYIDSYSGKKCTRVISTRTTWWG
jgi:hypothetical protein